MILPAGILLHKNKKIKKKKNKHKKKNNEEEDKIYILTPFVYFNTC